MGMKSKQRPRETFDGQELQNQDAVVEQVRRSAAWCISKYEYSSSQNWQNYIEYTLDTK